MFGRGWADSREADGWNVTAYSTDDTALYRPIGNGRIHDDEDILRRALAYLDTKDVRPRGAEPPVASPRGRSTPEGR